MYMAYPPSITEEQELPQPTNIFTKNIHDISTNTKDKIKTNDWIKVERKNEIQKIVHEIEECISLLRGHL